MSRALALVLVAVAAALGAAATPGCSDDACDASVTFAYTCEPQTDPTNACAGGPMLDGAQHDPDELYALGCFAGAATCSGGEQQVAHDCECISGFAGPTWACPP